MKGIISSHSARAAHQRQSAADAVAVSQSQASREAAVSSTKLRAIRVSSSEEARALAGGEAVVDSPKVEPSGSEDARALDGGEAVVDSAKVERLRGAIAAGNLQFDAQLVAQRLLDQAE